MKAIVHVTHEAVHKVGGIGSVLHGLITAPSYDDFADRTILLGPLPQNGNNHPLGLEGEVIYDRALGIGSDVVGPGLRQVEMTREVRLVCGRRRMKNA